MKVAFIKSLPYDVTMNGRYSKYAGSIRLLEEYLDPQLLVPAPSTSLIRKKTFYTHIYTSPSLRTIETSTMFFGNERSELTLLREIQFKLSNLVSEEEFNIKGSDIVRKKFNESFAENTLIESHTQLQYRIDRLLLYLKELPDKSTPICIGHSFFMKVVEAYIHSNYRLFESPIIINNFLPAGQQTYPYGQGYEIDI